MAPLGTTPSPNLTVKENTTTLASNTNMNRVSYVNVKNERIAKQPDKILLFIRSIADEVVAVFKLYKLAVGRRVAVLRVRKNIQKFKQIWSYK